MGVETLISRPAALSHRGLTVEQRRSLGIDEGLIRLSVGIENGRDLIDDAQLIQRYLKDVGIDAELKLQEYGAYMATTVQGKFEAWCGVPPGSPGSRIEDCIAPMRPTRP